MADTFGISFVYLISCQIAQSNKQLSTVTMDKQDSKCFRLGPQIFAPLEL